MIELSMVLVIIGLLVGSVLVGRDLIHAAELRAAIRQIEEVKTAVLTYRVKYNGLPGDQVIATQIWGAANVDPVACFTTVRAGTTTCNGNGDGLIDGATESPILWQQLENAHLIAQNMNGGDCENNSYNTPEEFFFKVKLPDLWLSAGTLDFSIFTGVNLLFLGGAPGNPIHGCGVTTEAMEMAEAAEIDRKMDDGNIATGSAMGIKNAPDDDLFGMIFKAGF